MNIQNHYIVPLYVHISRHQFPSKKVEFSFPYRNMHKHQFLMNLWKNKTEQLRKFIFKAFCGQPEVCLLQHNVAKYHTSLKYQTLEWYPHDTNICVHSKLKHKKEKGLITLTSLNGFIPQGRFTDVQRNRDKLSKSVLTVQIFTLLCGSYSPYFQSSPPESR